ncbi:acyl-CoA dehydrogenase family protein [Elongatibacter sediminis]|uniref:Acyl-CoA dehydrogenase family protein n=1 Tax=Elongatibacter sediminis TaxID=3119006 RepID=A0AAW9R7R2_9GAMM
MDFQLSEEQEQLRESVRRYASDRLLTLAESIEQTGEPPSHELLREFAEMGYLGINIPEDLGGQGLGNLEALIVIEELGRVSSAVGFPVFESCVGPVRAIEKFASRELAESVVPEVCAGNKVIAIAMSEPAAGSALTDLTTRAEIRGQEVVLNGTKRWCSGGGHADGYVVYCRFSDQPGAKSIGAVYVEKETDGLSFGRPEHLMGFRGVPSCDLYFDEVRVPLHHVVVPEGGFKQLMGAFDLERCGNATMALAQASSALDDVCAYVQDRHQFGKPIVDFQAVQLKLAEMKMQVEAARLLIWRAAVDAERGFPSISASSIAKCFANEIARTVTGNAMQLMGGYGYSKEYPMERRFRDAWGWGIAGGAIDIQKVNIASAMIGRRFNQRG